MQSVQRSRRKHERWFSELHNKLYYMYIYIHILEMSAKLTTHSTCSNMTLFSTLPVGGSAIPVESFWPGLSLLGTGVERGGPV